MSVILGWAVGVGSALAGFFSSLFSIITGTILDVVKLLAQAVVAEIKNELRLAN